ncbi:hypothetical protein SAMN02910356_02427 [Selenomonas sp. GACV-9]|uniref:hypothetical protein n=1 Tax=Selenomonas sp. GACV-9 TaxID=3158782 RepID=UPI0008E84342|nr:hypothetical protein SAMN02910356_02427 [Selenomonas ruminantium]
MELFPPLVAGVLIVLIGVLSVVSLVGVAYNWSVIISGRSQFNKIADLEKEVASLKQDIKVLKSRLSAEEAALQAQQEAKSAEQALEKEAELAETQHEVWHAFLVDYNNLAASMDVPKAQQACETFVQANALEPFICIDHAAQENGQIMPKFAAAADVAQSTYWAWPVPEAVGAYIVVPNPLHPYDQKLHTEGGMKETFASNYEQGEFHDVQVRLPAKFQKRNDQWKIIQPGVIRMK